MKQKKVKRKLNFKRIIIVLAIILFGVLIFLGYRSLKIKNIYVTGNKLLKEYEILEKTGLLEYPNIYIVDTKKIEKDLKEIDLIKNVKVHKTLFGKVTIEIEEYKVLYQKTNGKYVLSNNSEISLDYSLSLPTLVNDCNDVCEKLANKLMLVDDDILSHISEIEYKKTDLDKERFMFYMLDGNYVYITLSKINLINSYNEIYPTLDNKKGILYLDSGNHFEIKNKNEKEETEENKELKKEGTN